MTAPGSERRLVRYYCTAGNGMERFLTDEVKKKLAAEHVCHMPGKVLFSSSLGMDRVVELKAAERLFLLLKKDSPLQLSAHTSPAKAASVLQSKLLGDRNQWAGAVMTWSRLQGELAGRRMTTPDATSATLEVTRKKEEEERRSEEQQEEEEEEEKCDVESRKSAGEQREEERGNGRLSAVHALEKKRKRDDEEEEEEEERRGAARDFSSEKNVNTSETERRREGEEEMGMLVEFSSCRKNGKHGVISRADHSVESTNRRVDDVSKNFAVESVENINAAGGGRDDALLQPNRIRQKPPSVPISFRISCKCTGSLSRYFSTQEVSKIIGVGLSRLLGWKVDLKNPQLEVNVYLSDDHCLLGFPLTRLPLANRSYIKTTGLRSTVAWAMASLAQIQPGFCVVDPMCGVGTILIEAAQEHKAACFLGMDIDDGQLQRANENVEFAKLGNRIHLLKSSSTALPLPSTTVDAVVCDLPFGRKFGTKANVAANLPLILAEMERVLCIGGTLVLLLSPQLSCLLKKLLAQKDAGPKSKQETEPQTETQDCPSPSLSSTKQQTFQIHHGGSSPPIQETDPPSGLQHSMPPPLSSLKHQTTLRVSLGLIDGLIHKYIKMDPRSVQ
ncbi:THUMP domain-containing protein 2 [Larimichthys crocea]|uniref:THUMP domain-containing protein 2 n=1 Tax=Larimichthys crocea TaxID=215358 RepID=A0A6G0HPV5_LARCR|nr:THUMP domain-containing protein 2 [Larimichthys crocea]